MRDYRGYRVSGATPAALAGYENAVASLLSWRAGAEPMLDQVVLDAPDFTMAQIQRGYLALCSRDPVRVSQANAAYARAAALPADDRERMHLSVLAAGLADDFSTLQRRLAELLRSYPRDLPALMVAHAFDYLVGLPQAMLRRVEETLAHYPSGLPGQSALWSMQAFSLAEVGDFAAARDAAQRALQFDRFDARAHHALAHVFEMTDQPGAGIDWLLARRDNWSVGTVVATHLWWHCALYELARGRVRAALSLFDQRIAPAAAAQLPDLIDATGLLWRIELLGGAEVGVRWATLAQLWSGRIADRYCTFNDVHAILAFAGARDRRLAEQLAQSLSSQLRSATRYGETTRLIGLPACRAVIAFGDADYARAVQWLGPLPQQAWRIGGSHAQRDVLYLTLAEALRRVRRPSVRIGASKARAPIRVEPALVEWATAAAHGAPDSSAVTVTLR